MAKDVEQNITKKGWRATTNKVLAEMNIRVPTPTQLEADQPEIAAYRAANRIVGLSDPQVWDSMIRENANRRLSRFELNDHQPRKRSEIEDTES